MSESGWWLCRGRGRGRGSGSGSVPSVPGPPTGRRHLSRSGRGRWTGRDVRTPTEGSWERACSWVSVSGGDPGETPGGRTDRTGLSGSYRGSSEKDFRVSVRVPDPWSCTNTVRVGLPVCPDLSLTKCSHTCLDPPNGGRVCRRRNVGVSGVTEVLLRRKSGRVGSGREGKGPSPDGETRETHRLHRDGRGRAKGRGP